MTALNAVIQAIVIGELALNTQTLRYAYALALCLGCNIIIVPTALSADGEDSLDEVVVVATRAPEPLS